MEEWSFVGRPGYFGTSRDEIHEKYNDSYGKDNWKLSWQWGERIIEKERAHQIYEDAYFVFFNENDTERERILNTASNVWDNSLSNVNSGFDYNIQETLKGNHLHDIAIRSSLDRLGCEFRGDHLVQVRPGKEGKKYSPHLIPFHLPEMIYYGEILYKGKPRDFSKNPPWWREMGVLHSLEEFYQQNKILMVRE